MNELEIVDDLPNDDICLGELLSVKIDQRPTSLALVAAGVHGWLIVDVLSGKRYTTEEYSGSKPLIDFVADPKNGFTRLGPCRITVEKL